MYQNNKFRRFSKRRLESILIVLIVMFTFSFSLLGCVANSISTKQKSLVAINKNNDSIKKEDIKKDKNDDIAIEAERLLKKIKVEQGIHRSFVKPKDVFDKKVTLSFYNEPLSKVLPLIIDNFIFEKGVNPNTLVTLNVAEEEVSKALSILLNMSGLTYVKTTEGIVVQKQPFVTFHAYNQPFGIVISSMLNGYNYSISDGAEESIDTIVSADFNEVPFEQALNRLLSPVKLFWKKEGNVFHIFREKEEVFYITFPLMEQSFDITSSRAGTTTGGVSSVSSAGIGSGSSYGGDGGMSSALSSATATGTVASMASLASNIKEFLSKTGKFVVHKESGSIWVKDRADIVDRLGDFIKILNQKMSRSMHIDGIISQVTLNDEHKAGVDWEKILGAVSVNGYLATSNGDSSSEYRAGVFNLRSSFSINLLDYVNAMKTFGDVKIISKPSLNVTNGAIGSLIVGKTISYVAQSYSSVTAGGDTSTSSLIVKPLQTGLSFYVLPQIIDDEKALLYISPELTSLSKTLKESEFDSGNTKVQIPEVSLKQTQTVVNVINGDTVLISGLMEESSSEANKKVDVLGDIPIIGHFFKVKDNIKTTTEFDLMIRVSW